MGMRRITIGTAVVAMLAFAAPQALATGLVPGVVAGEHPRRAILDLTDAEDRTTNIDEAASLPAEAQGIGPGSHLLITVPGPAGGTFGCTASYVFESGPDLLLGAAGHCFLPEGTTATSGSGADHDPAGTVVEVCVAECSFGGASGFVITGQLETLGDVVYARQESKAGEQVGHDVGLVRIPSALRSQVRTSVPVFGGPSTLGTLEAGEQVCHYGNGVVVGEVFPTMGRTGTGISSEPEAWFAATLAAPGDSGAAVQTCTPGPDGLVGSEAIGTLTHLTLLGVAGTTNSQAVAMVKRDAGLTVSPALGALDDGGDDGSTTEPLLGSVTVSQDPDSTCPVGSTCTSVDVSCPGVEESVGAVVASRPAQGTARGLLALFSGELGTSWWATAGPGADMLDQLAEDRLATVQVRWTEGWLTSAAGEQAGPAALACRPATLIQWVHDELFAPLGVTSPGGGSCGFCVTGNSGGASALAYATTLYPVVGVDAVFPTSGPTHAALSEGCLRRAGEEQYWYSEGSARMIDQSYGFPDGGPCAAHDSSFAERWESDEVDTASRQPATGPRVHVIIGDLDRSHAPEHALAYVERVGGSVERIANMDHTIQQSVDGLSALRAAVTA